MPLMRVAVVYWDGFSTSGTLQTTAGTGRTRQSGGRVDTLRAPATRCDARAGPMLEREPASLLGSLVVMRPLS